jgi:hypothetical protein
MARLPKGTEAWISMAFVVMCAEKILRLLRLFFVAICAWFYQWQGPGSLLGLLRSFGNIEWLIHWPLYKYS